MIKIIFCIDLYNSNLCCRLCNVSAITGLTLTGCCKFWFTFSKLLTLNTRETNYRHITFPLQRRYMLSMDIV